MATVNELLDSIIRTANTLRVQYPDELAEYKKEIAKIDDALDDIVFAVEG